MDPFLVVMGGAAVAFLVILFLLGLSSSGIGGQQLDSDDRPRKSKMTIDPQQLDDLEQMIEAANRRRRRAGQSELTKANARQTLDPNAPSAAEDARLEAMVEMQDMLVRKNRERRRQGLPALTANELYDKLLRGEI